MQINGAEKVMEKALQSWCSLCAPQGYWEVREGGMHYARTYAIKGKNSDCSTCQKANSN